MNYLIHPITNEKISLFSYKGKQLLKDYIKVFQSGGSVEGGATKDEQGRKLSQRQQQLIEEGRYNLIKFTEKAIGRENLIKFTKEAIEPLQNDDEGRNNLRRLMELINTDDEEMIRHLGGDYLGHLSENKLKIFNLYRVWARNPDNNDSPEDLVKVMFSFGKPTSRILQILEELYQENNRRNNWFDEINKPSLAFMFGIVETTDGQILMSVSGDPSTIKDQDNKLYEKIYYHLFPMLNNLGYKVIEDDGEDGDIVNNYRKYKDYYASTTQRVGSTGKWGVDDPAKKFEDLIKPKKGTLNYIHNNRYLYGVRYVPFKREKSRGKVNCNNGSSCVESKLFAYMHRVNLKPLGMTSCWIGGNKHPNGPTPSRHCMDSYCFCIQDGKENSQDQKTKRAREENKIVINAMYEHLKVEINEAFPEEGNFTKAANIMQHFAVPCPGCQMNEARYRKGLPEIKWVNSVCTDIQKDMIVGGIKAMGEKTPGSSDFKRRTNTMVITAEEDGDGVAKAIDDGGDTDLLIGNIEAKEADPVAEAEGDDDTDGDARKLKVKIKKKSSPKKKGSSNKKQKKKRTSKKNK